MKTIIRTIAIVSVLLGAAACQQFQIDTQMTPEKAAANIRLVCDALDSYSLPASNPGTITFNVSSNTPWTITRSSGADWCEVSPSSSANSSLISDVVVTVKPNSGSEDRSATLTLKGENINKIVTIKIEQARYGKLFVTPIAKDFSACGGPLDFTLLTNVPWEVHSDASWLSFNRESGEPDPEGRTITIIATAQQSDVMNRTAIVTVVAGDDEESFEVNQVGKFEVTELATDFATEGSTQAFKIRTDLPWEVYSDKNWLTFDKEEGVGDGSSVVINATASANEGAIRSATVTVKAGGAAKEFTVKQRGLNFEIIPPATNELSRQGGEMLIEVNSSLNWTPETEVSAWTVEKVDDSHFKVVAPFNKFFKPISGIVAIVANGNRAEITLNQDINFKFEGNCEMLSDGSVKMSGGAKSRIITLDTYRYMSVNIELSNVVFTQGGEMWFTGQVGSANIYNQLTLGGNTRVRTDGNAADGISTYTSTYYDISEAELNAMTSYGMLLKPAEDPKMLHLEFLYNGETRGSQEGYNAFHATPDGSVFWFGGWNSFDAGTSYVVKSFDIQVIEG